jgi:hypothetical protein
MTVPLVWCRNGMAGQPFTVAANFFQDHCHRHVFTCHCYQWPHLFVHYFGFQPSCHGIVMI